MKQNKGADQLSVQLFEMFFDIILKLFNKSKMVPISQHSHPESSSLFGSTIEANI